MLVEQHRSLGLAGDAEPSPGTEEGAAAVDLLLITDGLERDPEVDLDVVANTPIRFPVRHLMKNAFGFGGLNASAIVARYEDGLD